MECHSQPAPTGGEGMQPAAKAGSVLEMWMDKPVGQLKEEVGTAALHQ